MTIQNAQITPFYSKTRQHCVTTVENVPPHFCTAYLSPGEEIPENRLQGLSHDNLNFTHDTLLAVPELMVVHPEKLCFPNRLTKKSQEGIDLNYPLTTILLK